jgi:hypothetical protein
MGPHGCDLASYPCGIGWPGRHGRFVGFVVLASFHISFVEFRCAFLVLPLNRHNAGSYETLAAAFRTSAVTIERQRYRRWNHRVARRSREQHLAPAIVPSFVLMGT